jgi:hypothetical protein
MRKMIIAGFALALLMFVGVRAADEAPKMPTPQKEHEWLKQLAGEWDLEISIQEPGKDVVKEKGSESTRLLGGFWSVAEIKSSMMGMPFTGILTLGYDTKQKKYVATWVDSMGDNLWKYDGTVDESGKILTLDTMGPCPMQGGKITKFQDVVEIKDKYHRTFKSSVDFDGKMVQMLSINYTRKNTTAAAAN